MREARRRYGDDEAARQEVFTRLYAKHKGEAYQRHRNLMRGEAADKQPRLAPTNRLGDKLQSRKGRLVLALVSLLGAGERAHRLRVGCERPKPLTPTEHRTGRHGIRADAFVLASISPVGI